MARVSVIIPTVDGREDSLRRCIESYEATTPPGSTLEFLVVRNRSSCGEAWQVGAGLATGEFLHVTADDIEALPGWLDAAVACLEDGYLPTPVLYLPWTGVDGAVLTDGETLDDGAPAPMTPLLFCRVGDWPGCPPVHYWSDFAVSERLTLTGWRIRWCHGYRFVHHRHRDQARTRAEWRIRQDHETYMTDMRRFAADLQGVAA